MTLPRNFASRVLTRALMCSAISLLSAPLYAMNQPSQPTPQALAQQADWIQLQQDNNQLAEQVLANQELAQALGEKPELIGHVAKNPNLIQLVQQNPGLIALALAHPQHIPQVATNPQAIPAILAKFGQAQQAGAAAAAGQAGPAQPKAKKKKAPKPGQAGAGAPDNNDGEDKEGAERREQQKAAQARPKGGMAYNMSRDVIAGMQDAMGTPEEAFGRAIRAARTELGTPEEMLNRAVAASRQSLGTPEENMARIANAIQQFMQEAQAGGPAAPGQLNGEGRAALRGALQAFIQEIGRMLQEGFAANGDMERGMGEAVNAIGRAIQPALQDGGAFDQVGAEGVQALNRVANLFIADVRRQMADGGNLDQAIADGANAFDRNLGRFGDALMNQIGDGGELRRALDEMQRMAIQNSSEFLNLGITFAKWTGLISALGYFSYFTSQYGLKVFWDHVDRKLRQPKLLIASSQPTFLEKLHLTSRPKDKPVEMVLSPEQEARFTEFEAALQITRKRIKQGKKNITYRWLCMAGPPGTGKTLKARDLARKYGMDFAEITGASLSQFKNGTAITEIDKLFTWAKSESDKGVVIFIDEVDSLLMSREKLDQGSEQYAIVNHILNHTGDRSDRFMLIMTTNHVEGLDQAIYDRVDDFVAMGLPDKAHRERVLMFYINKVFLNTENDATVIEQARAVFTPEFVGQMAAKTDGYSNRSLHGFINMLYGNTLIAPDCKVTPEIVNKTLAQMAQKMKLMQVVEGKQKSIPASLGLPGQVAVAA
jgi:MoxR-like ATPase